VYVTNVQLPPWSSLTQRPPGRAKGEPFAGRIERKRMAIAINTRELAGM